jgi:hypothetical protein
VIDADFGSSSASVRTNEMGSISWSVGSEWLRLRILGFGRRAPSAEYSYFACRRTISHFQLMRNCARFSLGRMTVPLG